MGVEIKYLTVKTTITNGCHKDADSEYRKSAMDMELLKEQILDACKEQVEQMLNDRRDR